MRSLILVFQIKEVFRQTIQEDMKQAQMYARLHEDFAIDYFLTPRYGFPWQDIPPIVVGRPEVDNYIVSDRLVGISAPSRHNDDKAISSNHTIRMINKGMIMLLFGNSDHGYAFNCVHCTSASLTVPLCVCYSCGTLVITHA